MQPKIRSRSFENAMFNLAVKLSLTPHDMEFDFFESSTDYEIVKSDVKQLLPNIDILKNSGISSIHIISRNKISKFVNIGNKVFSSKKNALRFKGGSLNSFSDSVSKFINSTKLKYTL